MLDFTEDFTEVKTREVESGLWVNKYRPKTLDDVCLENGAKEVFAAQIAAKDIQNITLVGPPGTGKTTLALVLCNEINAEPLFIPCAAGEGRIDTIAGKIIPFCQYSSSNRKVVILDELDSASATQANSFQKALRNVIETFSDCRFIATANYTENILEPILSRMPPMTLSFDTKQMLQRALFIFKNEGVDFSGIDAKVLKSLLSDTIRRTYPDIRSLFGKLQMACAGGVLTEAKLRSLSIGIDDENSAYADFYDKILEAIAAYAPRPLMLRSTVNTLITKAITDGNDPLGKLSSAYNFSKGLLERALAKDEWWDEGVKLNSILELTRQLNVIEGCIDKETQVFRFLLLLVGAMKK